MGFNPPFPSVGHRRLGNGLDAPFDLGLAEFVGAGPSWVVSAAHMADLVNSALEGRNSAKDKSPQEIIGSQPILFEISDHLVVMVDLGDRFPRVIRPDELFYRGSEGECR